MNKQCLSYASCRGTLRHFRCIVQKPWVLLVLVVLGRVSAPACCRFPGTAALVTLPAKRSRMGSWTTADIPAGKNWYQSPDRQWQMLLGDEGFGGEGEAVGQGVKISDWCFAVF